MFDQSFDVADIMFEGIFGLHREADCGCCPDSDLGDEALIRLAM